MLIASFLTGIVSGVNNSDALDPSDKQAITIFLTQSAEQIDAEQLAQEGEKVSCLGLGRYRLRPQGTTVLGLKSYCFIGLKGICSLRNYPMYWQLTAFDA